MVKKILNNFLNILENNEYLILYLTTIIILYVCFIGEKIPNFIENIFQNKIIKMVAISLIIFRAPNNTFMSILYTLAFLVTIDKSSNNKINRIKESIKINNKKTLSKKENFSEKVFTPDDFSYKNELNKLIKIKENFAQTQVEPLGVENCTNKWDNYDYDFGNSANTNSPGRMFHIESRCVNKDFPKPEILLQKIEKLKEEYEKFNLQTSFQMLDQEKYNYNVYRKIFKDYKLFENNLDKKPDFINKNIII